MPTKDLTEAVISDEAKQFLAGAPQSITNDQEMAEAAGWVAALRVKIKGWEKFFADLRKPIKKALADLKAKEEGVVGEAQKVHDKINFAVLAYRQAQQAAVKAAQAQENQAYKELAQEASQMGQDVSQVPVPSVLPTPARSLAVEAGNVSFQQVVKARLTSEPTATTDSRPDMWRNATLAEIPDECWMIDWRRVLARAKAGSDTPGVIRYTEEISKVRS